MELEISTLRPAVGAVERDDAGARARAAPRHRARRSRSTSGSARSSADERKFKQILLNLLSNAVKFTPDGGRVDVAAQRSTTASVEVAVRDTGIGIAPEDQAAVFEEFQQVGRDYTKKAEGTGLGLRSPSASSSCTAARSASRARPARAPPSPSRYRYANEDRQ